MSQTFKPFILCRYSWGPFISYFSKSSFKRIPKEALNFNWYKHIHLTLIHDVLNLNPWLKSKGPFGWRILLSFLTKKASFIKNSFVSNYPHTSQSEPPEIWKTFACSALSVFHFTVSLHLTEQSPPSPGPNKTFMWGLPPSFIRVHHSCLWKC